jgi:hypothetical protein
VGHGGVQRWWGDLMDAFDELEWQLVDLIDIDDSRVLTSQRFIARFRQTGIEDELVLGLDHLGQQRPDHRGDRVTSARAGSQTYDLLTSGIRATRSCQSGGR